MIGSMGVAIGVCTYALANKISQPGMTFSKAARKGGIHAQYEGVDEVKPMWSNSKKWSESIFEKSNTITENKRAAPPVPLQSKAEDVVEIIKEAPAAEEPAAAESAVDVVVAAVEEAVVDSSAEDKLLEKGAALAAELKQIKPDPPAAIA